VGVNTSLTNKLVHEAFLKKTISYWKDFDSIKPEVKINEKTRLDFFLEGGKKKRYVEVKNVSMSEPPWAVFPDAVTERGQKHLQELMKLKDEGFETEILFVVQREDCDKFRPAHHIDPVYAQMLKKAFNHGVLIHCWVCKVNKNEISLNHQIPVDLSQVPS
jgi:sugar fermentation stimulation protein A